MKSLRISVGLLIFLLCLPVCRVQTLWAQTTPDEGQMFPDIKLPIPQTMAEREYLNVYEGPFLLSHVDAEVLIVQIYSMYCPHCQKEAPNVNALYKAIAARPETKQHIKIIGIGAGNSPFEVEAFKKLFQIEFPLIQDEDWTVHEILGKVRTPYFFVLLKKPSGLQVVYSREGSIGDPGNFLDLVCARTGIGLGK